MLIVPLLYNQYFLQLVPPYLQYLSSVLSQFPARMVRATRNPATHHSHMLCVPLSLSQTPTPMITKLSHTVSQRTGAQWATMRWRTVWGKCFRHPNQVSPWMASQTPALLIASVWGCCPISIATSRSSRLGGTLERECISSTWEEKCTLSASQRRAYLCRAQTPTCATTGIQRLFARSHQVSFKKRRLHILLV